LKAARLMDVMLAYRIGDPDKYAPAAEEFATKLIGAIEFC
jgi:hypothetical protein